jgi:hypothetical protein
MVKYNAKLADFIFQQKVGGWWVTYQQPSGKKAYRQFITDTKIIAATKGTDFPKVKDLNELRRLVKKP